MKQCLKQAELKIRLVFSIQFSSKATNTSHICSDLRQKFERSKEQLLCAAKEAVQLKKRAERQAPWETYKAQFEQLPDDLEELRGLIESNKASLECFRGDIRILSIYRRVQEEIVNEEHEVEDLQAITQTEGDEISKIRVGSNCIGECFASIVMTCNFTTFAGVLACSTPGCCGRNRPKFSRVLS